MPEPVMMNSVYCFPDWKRQTQKNISLTSASILPIMPDCITKNIRFIPDMPVTAPLLPVSKTWTGYSTAACSSWSRIPLLSFKLYALTVFCRRYSQRRLEYLHEMFLILIAYRLTDLVDTHIRGLQQALGFLHTQIL